MATLKTIPPNKIAVAQNQMSKIWDKVKSKVPTEIREDEKHLYHVVIVEGAFNRHTLETKFNVKSQCYNGRSWISVKDRLKQLGYTNVTLIHDPTVKEVELPKSKGEKKEETQSGEPENLEPKEGDNVGGEDEKKEPTKRSLLIARVKELGYDGALYVKNVILEKFIEDALRVANENEDED